MNEIERVAIVTGGSRGIGRGIVLALAEKGWRVVFSYRGNTEAAEAVRQHLEEIGKPGLAVQADIASAVDREMLVNRVLDEYGGIDLLVNNAGMAPRQRMDLLEMGEPSYDEVMATNLKGPFFLTQRVARVMVEQVRSGAARNPTIVDDGSVSAGVTPMIVNIGSLSTYTSSTNRGEYCLSKAGLGMMTALFADRLAGDGILVYEVRPGIVDTDMIEKVKEKYD